MFPIELVPRLCDRIGAPLDESEWRALVERSNHCKKRVELGNSEGALSSPDASSSMAPIPTPMSTMSDNRSASSLSLGGSVGGGMSVSSVEEEVGRLREENRALKRKLFQAEATCKETKKKLNCQKSRIFRLSKAYAKAKAKAMKSCDLEMQVTKTKSDRNLTREGSMAIAVRMGLSSCSALSFPRAAWVDISRHTVTRCEVNFAAGIHIRSTIVSYLMFRRPLLARCGKDDCPTSELLKVLQFLLDFKCCKPFLHIVQQLCSRNNTATGSLGNSAQETQEINFVEDDADDDETTLADQRALLKETVSAVHNLVGVPLTLSDTSASATLYISGLSLQNDATNSEIWHRKKLTSMVVEVCALVDLQALGNGNYTTAFYSDQFMWPSWKTSTVCPFF